MLSGIKDKKLIGNQRPLIDLSQKCFVVSSIVCQTCKFSGKQIRLF